MYLIPWSPFGPCKPIICIVNKNKLINTQYFKCIQIVYITEKNKVIWIILFECLMFEIPGGDGGWGVERNDVLIEGIFSINVVQ